MTIQYAILGLLSWQPFSGYDLKKFFADSTVFYWSGNNNQIYRSLIQLHQDGLVTQEVHLQDSLPAKKIYTITDKGRAALKDWVRSAPELPEFRNAFLIQLAWADQLEAADLDALLDRYEEELQTQLLMQREKARRDNPTPARTQREAFLWEMISENTIAAYENELNWLRRLRQGLAVGGER